MEIITKLKKFVVLLPALFMSGCSAVDVDSALYQSIQEQTSALSQTTGEEMKQNSWIYLSQKAFELSNTLKGVAPFVIGGSLLIGFLIRHIVTEDVGVRKNAVIIFWVTIPLVMIIATYGIAYLCGVFM